jgi:hypothetical protein
MKKISGFLALVLFFSFLLSNNIAFATKYYVDPSSTSSTANGSLQSPWKTIAQVNTGTSILLPGDTVLFKRGQTYVGKLNVAKSGTAANPIVYTNYGTGTLPEFTNTVSGVITIYSKQYIVIDGIAITDRTISATDHSIQAKISYAIIVDNSPNCTIKNSDISLVGVAIEIAGGSNNTLVTNNYFHNLRMVRNTVGGDDDYGANPMVVGSSSNMITNNRFEECWGLSYDYGFDGGAVELFGSTMDNNKIMYNTAINCNGFIEIGSSTNGSASNNIIAYNKVINCGILGVYQNGATFSVTVNNLQYYNNTVVETVKQYAKPSVLFWMAGTGNQGMLVVKNNIFWLSSGVNVASSKFNTGQMIHSNNIYRMTTGVLGITANSTELQSSTASLFTSVSGTPDQWNYNLNPTSAAINFGTGVGISKDFIGNQINGNPDAGKLEYAATSSPSLSVSATKGNIACFGGKADVTVTAAGGTSPYTGTGTFNVAAGTYKYVVSDAKGIKDSTTVIVSQPTALNVVPTAGSISGFGATTSITVAGIGGTSPYQFNLNSGAYQSSNLFSAIGAGTYTLGVRDNNGCIASQSIVISQPTALTISATKGSITCFGGKTDVTVTAAGGTSPYTGTGTFNVAAGTYKYVVSDAKGIKDSTTVIVSQPTALNVVPTAGSISGFGATTSITVAGIGGTSPYQFNLNSGAYQSSNLFSAIGAGTYTLGVRDNNGCIASQSIVISQPTALTISATKGSITCFGGKTDVTVTAAGGTSPYTGTGTFNVAAGTYKYIVSDAKGIKDSVTVTLTQPTILSIVPTAGTINTSGGTTSITVAGLGGIWPYTFNLNNGTYQSSNLFSNISAGTFILGVKDNNGCTANKSITIAEPSITTSTVTKETRVFPNPSNSFFTVTFSKTHRNRNVNLKVVDLQGNIKFSASGNTDMNFKFGYAFSPGTYFLKVYINGKGETITLIKL